ncbi:tail length tape measure protein [Cronobacter phage ESP2949-1]|uniref:Tail tape-measure protein n=1 Tax=Cronobacter phage ESP2949-1 TaxID=2920894 RepID=G1CSQ1_9CAUD|nr:tail length tape measure protein [Cronobacter phage ESP2949-1]AEM24767.1 tail tape-measure protein [Cronobacter phage ESP2949-1]
MAEQFAGIALGVDVSQVDNATRSLKRFKEANQEAAKGISEFVDAEQVAKQQAKDHSAEVSKQAKAYREIQNAIDPTAKKMDRLRAAAEQLDNLWNKGVVPDKQFFELSEMLEQQQNKLAVAKKALTEEGRAALEESRQKAKATAEGQKFIATLKAQADAAGKAQSELVEMRAAQLGVSEAAAPFVASLREQEAAVSKLGVSMGQYKQAMRMLPAQITDVVTSLASGMPVWMVAIQQGGQIKDSFGGIGNTFRELATFITPMNVAIGAAAAALGGLVFYAIKSQTELDNLKKSISESLGISEAYAQKLAINIRNIADASGKTADEVTAAFVSTKDGAGEAIQKLLDVGYSYQDAKDLVNQYKNASNFTAVNEEIEKHKLKAAGIKDSWSDVAQGVKEYYTAASLGRANVALGGAYDGSLQELQKTRDFVAASKQGWLDGQKAAAAANEEIGKMYLNTNRVAGAEKELQEIYKLRSKAQLTGDKEAIRQSEYLIEQKKKEIKEIQEAEAKKNRPKKSPIVRGATETYDQETLALQAQLKTLREHTTINDRISRQRQNLFETEAKISILEDAQGKRRLSASEQELLTNKASVLETARRNAELGDAIQLQTRMNKLQQDSSNYMRDLEDQQQSINLRAKGYTDQQIQREEQLNAIRKKYEQAAEGVTDQDKIAEINRQKDAVLAAQQKLYDSEDSLSSNWLAGAKNAFAKYGESAMDMYSNVGKIAGAALNGLSNQMTEFLTTGKASFKDFATSIIKMIVEMISKMVIFNALSGLTGGKTWGMSDIIGSFAGGGYTGAGGKYEPKGVVHGGEFVFTKEATSRIGVKNLYRMMRGYANGGQVGGSSFGGSYRTVAGSAFNFGDINVEVNNGNDPASTERGVKMIFEQLIREACTQGGAVYNYVESKR